MKRGLRAAIVIALISAVGCSLFVQIDDSKIPPDPSDASSDSALDASTETAPDAPLDTTINVDSGTPDAIVEAAPDSLLDAVDDTSLEDSSDSSDSQIDVLEDGG